ncbi:MAG TPA: hypothetical protein VEH56_06470 [Candidatus Saccharimonadales bacterium]|nr:hypothetical protein [Candidatus Saccharimonadales bacterium]
MAVVFVDVYSDVDCHLCFFTPLVVLVGLNAAVTYSRAWAHSRRRSEGCPFTYTPDRYWVMWYSSLPTAQNLHRHT